MTRDVPLAGRHRLAGKARRLLASVNPRGGGQHGLQGKTGFPRTHGDFFKPPGRNEPLRRLGREKERGDLFPCGERGQHRGIPGERVQIQNVRSLIFGDVGHDTWPQAVLCVGALGVFIVSVIGSRRCCLGNAFLVLEKRVVCQTLPARLFQVATPSSIARDIRHYTLFSYCCQGQNLQAKICMP